MKKTLVLGALLLSLGIASPVAAQDSVRAELEAKRALLRDQIKENQERLKENLERLKGSSADAGNATSSEAKREGLENRLGGIENRVEVAARVLSANVVRLETLIERIESRMEKVEAAGIDTSLAEESVANAKADIEHAEEHIGAMLTIDFSDSEKLRENLELVKAELAEAREALISAKRNLMSAVQLLKGLGENATTTPQE